MAIDTDGLVGPTRAQAYGPRWRRTSPGRFVPSAVGDSIRVSRVEQRILEASGCLVPGGAVSGWAALRLHGGNFFDGGQHRDAPVPVVVPRDVRGTGIVVHRAKLRDDELTECHGIPVTTPARAAIDAARWAPDLRAAVVALDMATAARLTSLHDIAEVAAGMRGFPGVEQVRQALKLADDRSMSPQESVMRLIWVLDAGLPKPLCNWPLADLDGRRLGAADLLCEELGVLGEYDGAEHRSRNRHRADADREHAFAEAGLERFVIVGSHLHNTRLTVARMQAAVRRAAESKRPRRWMRHANPPPVCSRP